MGVGKIFSREGPLGDFPKLFQGGTQNGEICFFPTQNKQNNVFLLEISNSMGAGTHLPSLPTPMDENIKAARFLWSLR